jgi:hypothetical protein
MLTWRYVTVSKVKLPDSNLSNVERQNVNMTNCRSFKSSTRHIAKMSNCWLPNGMLGLDFSKLVICRSTIWYYCTTWHLPNCLCMWYMQSRTWICNFVQLHFVQLHFVWLCFDWLGTFCPTTPCLTTFCPTTLCTTTPCPTTLCPTTLCPTTLCPTTLCPTTLCRTTLCFTTLYPTTLCPTTLSQLHFAQLHFVRFHIPTTL